MNDPYERARKRVDEKKGFYKHLTVFVLINLFFNLSSLLSGNGFSSWSMTFFWGIGIVFHYINVFGPLNSRFDEDWEEREIERELNKMGYSSKDGDISRKDIDHRLKKRSNEGGYKKSDLV
ncbi:MAG: 2TM domain-containing protein [Bacteroidetes bacterium]|nr:2TM domain-containing protein [Bacteroidota bacterium]